MNNNNYNNNNNCEYDNKIEFFEIIEPKKIIRNIPSVLNDIKKIQILIQKNIMMIEMIIIILIILKMNLKCSIIL